MHAISGWKRLRRTALFLGVIAALGVLGVTLLAPAADHRDGPIFASSTTRFGTQDINDVYVFTSPANSANTVIAFTFQPFPGLLTPATFPTNQYYDIKVDNTGDAVEDLTFRVTFGPANTQGVQTVTVRAIPAARFPPNGIVAQGQTGTNIPVRGGGMFRADNFDDPFFFDATAFSELVQGIRSPFNPTLPYPRPRPTPPNSPSNPNDVPDTDPRSQARNFFLNANTLGYVLELPATKLRGTNGTKIGVWGRIEAAGQQPDRMGRPAINTALIPPLPRPGNKAIPGTPLPSGADLRNLFNAGQPRNDPRDFRGAMASVIKGFYNPVIAKAGKKPFTDAEVNTLVGFLLPDILTFDTSKPFVQNIAGNDAASAFPNGRQPRDPVIHIELNLLSGGRAILGATGPDAQGAITTDNVDDDNGTIITDGTNGAPVRFPYLGPPNVPQGNVEKVS